MLITRECDYALRIVRNLSPNEVTSIHTIVERESITNAIAYKVARKLEKAGLLRSIRGNSGGYLLTRGLDEITILDVYKIMEPNPAINECLKQGRECPLLNDEKPCAVHYELERIQNALFEELGKRSLLEIVTEDAIGIARTDDAQHAS